MPHDDRATRPADLRPAASAAERFARAAEVARLAGMGAERAARQAERPAEGERGADRGTAPGPEARGGTAARPAV